MSRTRLKRIARGTARALVFTVALLLVLIGLAIGSLETSWGKNQLRRIVVAQANRYLTATLDIGRLGGSILRGLELEDVRLSRGGDAIVNIERVTLSYNLRELVSGGTSVRSIRLERPQFFIAKQPDGHWNITSLVRREARERERTGPRRSISLPRIEIVDGLVVLRDPLMFGAARAPSRYEDLNITTAFAYEPVAWRLDFSNASWIGAPGELTVERLTGGVANGHEGWEFHNLSVRTSKTSFILDGRVIRTSPPTLLDLTVHATTFDFPEWGGVLSGLKNIEIDSAFDVHLKGPLTALATDLTLKSNGGAAQGTLVLDTSVPGWHGKGSLSLTRLDLAPWFNRPDRPSDITGRVDFDMALELGHGFPRGSYVFAGRHAEYLGYTGDNLRVRGTVTETAWRIASGTGNAYGSAMTLAAGSINLASPYAFHFEGTAGGVDLRALPDSIPVPHVESLLTFDYVADGQFISPFLIGRARFGNSEFIGSRVAAGTVGSIDTQATPIHYTGEGEVRGIDLHRYGAALDVDWMREPRYAGTVSGHFNVDVRGADTASLALTANGRLDRAEFFGGAMSDANITMTIDQGTIRGTYDGRFSTLNPAIAFDEPPIRSSLSGAGRVEYEVRDLLTRTPTLDDFTVSGDVAFEQSTIRDVTVDTGDVSATLAHGSLEIAAARAESAEAAATGSGVIVFDDREPSSFDYDVTHADLALLGRLGGPDASGALATRGHLSGPSTALRLVGDASLTDVHAQGVGVLSTNGSYDVTFPLDNPQQVTASIKAQASFLSGYGIDLQQAEGTVSYDKRDVTLDVALSREDGTTGAVAGAFTLHPDNAALDLSALSVTLGRASWRLLASQPNTARPVLRWGNGEIAVSPVVFVDAANGDQQVHLDGTWRSDGDGALNVRTRHLSLDNLTASSNAPARYGGVLDADAVVSGTRDRPTVKGTVTVTEGRVERVTYERLAGKIGYSDEMLQIDLRLDQAPGVWLNATGTVPTSLFDTSLPEQPIDFVLTSSDVSLGLLEGLTDVVTNVAGTLRANVRVVGTSRDPHFDGTLEIAKASFQVTDTGARYKNGAATFELATDRLTVASFHLEDRNGRPLEVTGSLGTHELRVGDLAIDITAKRFEVLRDTDGTVDVNAQLRIRGEYEEPRISGTVTVVGGELKVDEILSRALAQPYATQPLAAPQVDPIRALNPWERLAIDVKLQSPGTLRFTGDNININEQSPIGLGSFDLRATGDLYFYKPKGGTLSVTGSFDSITGTYAFQGRRFDLYPSSSIDFRGDLNPELFITVSREISGVETRVTISGPLHEPELRLSSTPPLDPSDILSLIVFNTSTNELSAAQQEELAARAGTLAVGFLANSLISGLQKTMGIDILEIEPTSGVDAGTLVTIGQEIAPGLVARFSRQFGVSEYDIATIDYYISRLLRIRATFTDASATVARTTFRRLDRAGIDLLLFFSF